MQPQQPQPPVSQPAPNPQYDFILRDPQQPQRKFSLSGGPNLIKIVIGLVGIVVVVFIIVSVLGGKSQSGSQQLIAVAGRAQEIARVSLIVEQQSTDPNTQYLAATTQIALTSEQSQITTYLTSHGVKVSPTALLAYTDKSTDTQLQTAKQNNQLESTYDSYLKNSLTAYVSAMRAAVGGVSANALAILNAANTSTQVLLAAPEINALPLNS